MVVSNRGPGLMLVILGVGLVVAGLLVWTGALSWFGRLPGDIRWEGERGRVYVPIVSMLLVSVVLSVLLWFFQRGR
jgi:drug/metabolite transporter (DMT)-like permease